MDYPQLVFNVNEKSTDVQDKKGEFGIRKNDKKWEIYYVSSGEVIKETNSYSKFFNGEDWTPGQSELGSSTFTVSKEFPILLHEKIDGTVKSVKDVGYKYPEIFKIQWNQDTENGESFMVSLMFYIRYDIKPLKFTYSVSGNEINDLDIQIAEENKQWRLFIINFNDFFGGIKRGEIISFTIFTQKDILNKEGDVLIGDGVKDITAKEPLNSSSGNAGIEKNITETNLTYRVKSI
jgi:hypothetical protein